MEKNKLERLGNVPVRNDKIKNSGEIFIMVDKIKDAEKIINMNEGHIKELLRMRDEIIKE